MTTLIQTGAFERPQFLESTLGERLEEIGRRFGEDGALGLLVIEASSLTALERDLGVRQYLKARSQLAGLIGKFSRMYMRPTDLVASGDTGREETLLFFFRPADDQGFYLDVLERLPQAFSQLVEEAGSGLIDQRTQEPAGIAVGRAMALHKPCLREERQIYTLVEGGREDARLNALWRDRERRRSFTSLLMQGKVLSVYQPIVQLADGGVHGFEALVRGVPETDWRTPAALFGMACRTGLSFELDCLCRRVGLRGARGKLPKGAKLFLNCLPSAIHDPGFSERRLRETLESNGLTPSDLVFEVSEAESIRDYAAFLEARDYYRSLGFRFALDDTGAGYASLQTVMEIEPDYIKLDAALIRSIDTDVARQALVRALQSVATEMGSVLIAEGIETAAELGLVQTLEVPFGQGFFLGKPAALGSL